MLRAFHANWAYVVMVANLAVGLAGLWLYRTRRTASRPFWVGIGFGHLTVVTQVAVGLILFQNVRPPGRHTFYGFVLLIASVLSIQFIGREPRRRILIFSLFAIFLGAVAIRTAFTA